MACRLLRDRLSDKIHFFTIEWRSCSGVAELGGALNALSGEAYASQRSVLIGDSLCSRQAPLGRLRQGA